MGQETNVPVKSSCIHMVKPFPFSVESHPTLGQGFRNPLQNGLQRDLRETLESISEIKVALDHYQRGGARVRSQIQARYRVTTALESYGHNEESGISSTNLVTTEFNVTVN
jgi:hypothetical protein